VYACVPYIYETRHCVLTRLHETVLYIYISHSSGNEHIYKNILLLLLLLYRYRTEFFLFRLKSLLHSSCTSITCGICVSPYKKCTRMHTCTYTIINAIYVYIGVSFWCTFGYRLMEFVERPCFC